MCTLAFAHNMHSEYPFVFIGNRDEFYNRLTENAGIRKGVLSGLDLEKGGTWTGISTIGRMAFLTNHRDFTLHVKTPESRGLLTKNFLDGDMDPEMYLESLSKQKGQYNPYNLIVGNLSGFYFYSNIEDRIIKLDSGIYGLSNAFLDTPWPKIKRIKEALEQAVLNNQLDEKTLFSILENRSVANESDLPSTGLELEMEKSLSSIFIELETYGTRHETVILIDRLGRVHFVEKFRTEDGIWQTGRFDFNLKVNR